MGLPVGGCRALSRGYFEGGYVQKGAGARAARRARHAMAAMVVALDYDLLPGIEPGTWAQHAEVLASGATVQSSGACWRG